MATRKQKVNFAIKRFKGFWNQFKRSKRGMLGLAIIVAFSLVAIFAPLIAPYKPLEPSIPAGKYYPGVSTTGLKIAYPLSKPIWYKYLPWIQRGVVETTEKFYSYTYTELGIVRQNFIPEENYSPLYTLEEKKNVSVNDYILLSKKVSAITKIQVTFPNETTKEIPFPSDEAQYVPGTSRQIKISSIYPSDTRFDVTYQTGVDLVENMDIVKDHMFTSSASFDEWSLQTTEPASVNFEYDSQSGFAYTNQEKERGCLKLSYTSSETSSGTVNITILKRFSYPYYEAPKQFFVHTSLRLASESQVTMEILFFRENDGNWFLVKRHYLTPSSVYSHVTFLSDEPIIKEYVGVSPPQDKIFATPSNYSFAIRFIIPSDKDATMYMDNAQCIMYGNIFGLLGTDNAKPFPSDIFSLLVHGTNVSLTVGVLTAVFSTFIGLFLGLISGYVGGIVDEGIMRFTDLLLVLPTLPLFIVLTVSMRAASGYISIWNIIIILTLFGWMGFARSVRSMVLSIRERAFIEAAKAAGGSRLHIINRHIVPNVFALVYITLAMSVPGAIITEASLSWLGLGDPRLASWGKILYDFNVSGVVTSKGLLEYWFWVFPACIAIALLATAFVLVGYALDEILNPRLRERR